MSSPVAPRRFGYRWTVCALLFLVTTINYVDRQVLGILAPTLQRELHWSESQYGDVVSWFSLVYAFGFLAAGRLLDRVGVRRGFAVAVVAWSVAAIGHAFARSPETHPRVSGAELAHIRSDPAETVVAGIPWIGLLGARQAWAFAVGKLLADPIWWFYLYWLPKFLDTRYGIKLAQLALPLIVVYLVADAGSVGGGWFSSALIKRGWTVNRARKTAMLAMALLIVPTALAPLANSLWIAVLIVSVAAAAHQAWSANVYTLASDMFPRQAVGSVVGIGAFAGAMGGVLFQRVTGRVLQANGNDYTTIFVVFGLAYVTAWTLIPVLVPRLEPAQIGGATRGILFKEARQ